MLCNLDLFCTFTPLCIYRDRVICICIGPDRHTHMYTHRYSYTALYKCDNTKCTILKLLFFFFNMPYVFRVLYVFVFILSGGSKDFCAMSYLRYGWTWKWLPVISVKSHGCSDCHCSCVSVRTRKNASGMESCRWNWPVRVRRLCFLYRSLLSPKATLIYIPTKDLG